MISITNCYPSISTFVCPTEIIAFSDRIEEFKKLDCAVLAASCDSVYSHYAWLVKVELISCQSQTLLQLAIVIE